jgi:hypothetical protein
MKTYAPITALVTTTDGKCPDGYMQVESPIVNGGLSELVDYWRLKAENRLKQRDLIREQFDIVDRKRADAEAALHRIDGINDSPACFNKDIDDVIRGFFGSTADGGGKS